MKGVFIVFPKMNCLVIVESAAKAKTISKYLSTLYPDRSWTVSACFGHVRDLPAKTLGINTENGNWDVTWEILPTKKDTVSKLKKQAKEATMVYLASDPDLEGYAIAHHLQIALAIPMKKCIRVTFNEITKAALKISFDNPSGWNDAKVAAQETRRILDRLVGYQVSPLLWKVFPGARGLSAGRVQSAALYMIQKRFAEFENHDPHKSWILHGIFGSGSGTLTLNAKHEQVEQIDKLDVAQEHVQTIIQHGVRIQPKWNVEYSKKDTKKSPPLPFTTSSLQQEAFSHHKFPPKMTMSLAQTLYEEGHITYMRTDSTTLSEDAIEAIRAYITMEFGDDYTSREGSKRSVRTANPNAQEAHEAIRPTRITVKAGDIDFKSPAHAKLYDLIWRRSVSSQMAPAKYLAITYTITNPLPELNEYVFTGTTSLLTFQGWLRVYSPGSVINDTALQEWNTAITKARRVKITDLRADCEVSRPKLLYTETDLIKAMEKNGIGRPSTYVSIIEKLLTKGYVIKDKGPKKTVDLVHLIWNSSAESNVQMQLDEATIGGTDRDRMVPTELGQRILVYLETTLPDLLDLKFTASMEENLDKIEHKLIDKISVLNEFYGPFNTTVTSAMNAVRASDGGSGGSGRRKKDFTSFLKWRGVSEITEVDQRVLDTLPQIICGSGGDRITLGPYGVYVKTKDGKNKRLDKSKWEKVVNQSISVEDY